MARITVRRARLTDLPKYTQLQAERWSDENQATQEDLLSRFTAHPEGMFVAEQNGRVVGMVYAMRLADYDYDNPPNWYEITNNGACDNHVPNGIVIFGVDLSTAKGVGAEAGDKLLIAIARLAIREGVKWALLGGRMPGYHKYQSSMTAEEYLVAKDALGKPLDPQVRFYTGVPGLNAVKALPDYFNDPESCDYGVLLRWRNPLYGLPGKRVWSALFPLLYQAEELYLKLKKA